MDISIPGWTFTHMWVRPVTNFWFNIYHKSITYSGTEYVDWQKPIIFAVSHRNAFSDALCLILPERYTNNRFIYPLIRGDAFGNNQSLDWILSRFHMIPVYRPRDKVDMVTKNQIVFGHCHDLLAKKRNLLIHPEGNCIPQNRMRSFKKGLARIAFGAEEKYDFNLDVNIVPVGITYRQITEARKGIHVQYGEPICVADFKGRYRQNSATAINELTRTLHQKVGEQTVDLPKENYQLGEDLLWLRKSTGNNPSLGHRYSEAELRKNQEIANSLKKMNEERKTGQEFSSKMESLKNLISQNNLRIDLPLSSPPSAIGSVLPGFIFAVLSPLALYGWLNNLLPWALMHRLADKVQETQFKSSARMTLGLIFFPVFYLLQTLIVFFITHSLTDQWFWAPVYLFSLPTAGLLALNWHEKLQIWRQKIRLFFLPDDTRKKMNALIEELLSKLT